MSDIFLSIDLPAIFVGALSGLSGGLIGSVLLFKKQAMMADALSHSILPGIALAYIITGSISAIALFSGAFVSCLLAALCIIFIQSSTILDKGSIMGVVLTSMFALGVILLELYIGGRVHLDTEHALYGAIELTYWKEFGSWATLPDNILNLCIVNALLISTIIYLYKYILLYLYDPVFYKNLGFHPLWMDTFIIIATASVVVVCFDAVGSILVLALFICPAASVRMFTDQFKNQIIYSGVLGALTGAAGYCIGAWGPLFLGFENSISAAGSIAVLSGFIMFLSIIFAPKYGLLGSYKKPQMKKA